MGFEELDKTLDCICHDYDYGIVPNSVTVFVRDKVENVGRFELTLLEGILLIIDAFEDGFRVSSCTPLIETPNITASLNQVKDHVEVKFDTMDRLLMTISPIFAQRLLDKIHSTLAPQTLPQSFDEPDLATLGMFPIDASSQSQQQQQQQQPSSSSTYSDVFEWIH